MSFIFYYFGYVQAFYSNLLLKNILCNLSRFFREKEKLMLRSQKLTKTHISNMIQSALQGQTLLKKPDKIKFKQ